MKKIKKDLIIRTVLVALPSLWFTFLSIFARQLKLVNTHGEYNVGIILITVFMMLTVLGCAVFQYITESIEQNKKFLEEKLHKSLIKNIIDTNKNITFHNLAVILGNDKIVSEKELTNEIREIIIHIIRIFSEVLNIPEEKFVASYLFSLDYEKGEWIIVQSNSTYKDVSKETLLQNKASVFSQVYDCDVDVLFYASKDKAAENGKYIYDKRDNTEKSLGLPAGSIIACSQTIDNPITNKVYIKGLFAIATYGIEICEENDKKTKIKIINQIMNYCNERLSFTLAAITKYNKRK